MPLVATSKLAPPQDWKEFESLTRDALSEKWSSPDLEMNGRQGQDQAGVDIFGENHKGEFVGVQCKNTENLNLQTIIDEAQKAESFKPAINAYYVATTGKRDSVLQESVRLENIKRKASGTFSIQILFWDDIQSELAKNTMLFQKYYSQFMTQLPQESIVKGNRMVSALDLGFYGLNVRGIMGISFGLFGCTDKDIREFYSMLELIEEALSVIANTEQLPKRIEALNNFKKEINAIVDGKIKKWKEANELAEVLEDSIRNLTRWLEPNEVKIFGIGAQMGTWDYYTYYHYESYSREGLDKLSKRINDLLQLEKLPDEIENYIHDYLDPDSEIGKVSNAPTRTFNWVRQHYMTT
ncbi:hypothetical protein C173_20281 [Paenibacillus sp. FSL R7-277]|uniref:hypothetical protein n=1 Tax=unclassified Paenibacillus TaxID=185978 RepID=UPI0003E24F04|nr:hypothetical protein [Paenibacillus sp. FSL R7-277]ETT65402.1 hypothetical protein C173_20281 [Paenibacillus sp. FSL R7-277]